jgi:ribosomal protein L1
LLDTVVGEDESGEFIKKGEVVEFSDFVVAEIDALKEVESGAHVFDE